MQLINDEKDPDLLGVNPLDEDLAMVEQMVNHLNKSLAEDGYGYKYNVATVDNKVYIRQQ